MSDRVCYIRRSDRGALIRSALLLGERSEDRWDAEPAADAIGAESAAFDAADWIRSRLAETRSAKRLDTLCLDVDGAACSWVRGRDADAELIRSAIEGASLQGGPGSDDEALDPIQTPGIADRLPRLGRELDFDVLSQGDAETRAAVIAAPDAPARLLIDRLDAMGVRIGRVVTIWHAMAEAWDPGARAASTDRAGIVSTDHPPAAVVLIDPEDGRLVWSWSRQGRLLACGSMRLRRLRSDTRSVHAEVREHDIARLAGDWLGWSAQIGVSPSRVVVVGTPAPGGMSPGEIGRALTRAWPNAVADLIGHDDPVTETLRRTLDARPINAFRSLSERPTRTHRAAFRWSAVMLILAAACIAALAAGLFARASETRGLVTQVRQERTEALGSIDPQLALDPLPVVRLNERITQIERRTGALQVDPPRPVMQELEAISFVLGMPGVSVDLIEIVDTLVTVKVRVDNIPAAEQLSQALRSIGGSELQWRQPSVDSRGNEYVATYTALWPERTRARP